MGLPGLGVIIVGGTPMPFSGTWSPVITLWGAVPHGGGCLCPTSLLSTPSHPISSPSPKVC